MEATIIIRTPPGQAANTVKKIKFFLLGLPSRKTKLTESINAADDTITWIVDAPLNKLMKIQRNVSLYDNITHGVLNSKLAKKFIKKNLNAEDQHKLSYMLLKQTDVTFNFNGVGNHT